MRRNEARQNEARRGAAYPLVSPAVVLVDGLGVGRQLIRAEAADGLLELHGDGWMGVGGGWAEEHGEVLEEGRREERRPEKMRWDVS